MQPLFSLVGRRRLDQVVQPGMLCVFDFDGTLSPLVALPDDAHLPDEVLQRLLRLSQLAPVGVLTGRALDDIRRRLGFDPHYLVGNHGMEGLPGRENDQQQYRQICSGWIQQLTPALQALRAAMNLPENGLLVEDKRYSLSVHYRLAGEPERVLQALRDAVADLEPPPRVIDGKFVLNLLPADALDKGGALQALIDVSGCSTALYVGDDITDEDAFRLGHPGLLSVRIEPHEQSAAEFYLPRTGDIVHLLDFLIERLCADTVGVMPSGSQLTSGKRA